jgi:hypothetical protein
MPPKAKPKENTVGGQIALRGIKKIDSIYTKIAASKTRLSNQYTSGNSMDIKDEVLQKMDEAMVEIQEYKKMTTDNTADLEEEMRAFKTEMKAEILDLKTAMLELITTINTTSTTKQNETNCTSNIEDSVQETKGKVLGVKHEIHEMKSMLQAMETKTYAQAAATHPGISACDNCKLGKQRETKK